jgi:DNA-binding response OmpR family regulator
MTKVLIVDDEEVARITLSDILRLEGFSVQAAGSGEEAVAILHQENFDVMILDLRMPGMGGLDVLENVVDQLPDLQVIVLTAHGSMDSAIQALRFRVHDYLLKPITPTQILSSIQTAMERLAELTESKDDDEITPNVYRLPGGPCMDLNKRIITWEDGSLSLTPTEGRLLGVLIQQKGQMLTHAELVLQCQGYKVDNEEAAKILRPVVSRLRQKMSEMPGWTEWIKNIRGSGYVLELPED